MDRKEQNRSRKFLITQVILLSVTVICGVYFTIPFLETVQAVRNQDNLLKAENRLQKEATDSRKKLDVARAQVLMGAADEKLKKEVEDLKRELAIQEKEKKSLEQQLELARTAMELLKGKQAESSDVVDKSSKVADLFSKAFGGIVSLVSGVLFIVNWLRQKRGAFQNVAASS